MRHHHHGSQHGSHHGGKQHHIKKQRHPKVTHHKPYKPARHSGKHGGVTASSPGSQSAPTPTSAATVATQDAQQFANLVHQVASELLSGGFAAEIIDAIEAVVFKQVNNGPGTMLAGVISNLAGNIQYASGGHPTTAMVFLQGSSVAAPVYIPPHLQADIAGGQQIWVAPANGRRDDLVMVAARNFTTAPASSGYETSAHASATYETISAAASKAGIGTHNAASFTLSAGTTLPGSLDANEIFFLLA